MKKSKQTASEFIAKLHENPEWVAAKEKREQIHREKYAEIREAEQPLVRDLAEAGVFVESVWDLVNRSQPYPSALPVLVEHLSKSYPPRVREGIARALAVPASHFAWQLLLELFLVEPLASGSNVKWALACALAASATESELPRILLLTGDASLGRNRAPFIAFLRASNDPRAREKLVELVNDPALGQDAQAALKTIRTQARRRR